MKQSYTSIIRTITIILWLIISANYTFAQSPIRYDNIRFKQLDQSLIPNNTIRAITQDCDGYMWLGTQDGLCRYDGYTTKLFSYSDEDKNTIPHNDIVALASDSVHRAVWILTNNDISKYDIDNETIKRYETEKKTFRAINIISLPSGDVFTTFNNVVFRYNESDDKFERFISSTQENFNIRDITHVDDELWLTTNKGIKCYSLTKDKYTAIPPRLRKKEIQASSKIFNIDGNTLWFSNFNTTTIHVYNIAERKLKTIQMPKKARLRSAYLDSNNNVWLGGEGGIAIFDQDADLIYSFNQSNQSQNKLNDLAIYNIFRDSDGNMWIGTFFGGVNQYIEGSDTFSIYDYGTTGNTISGKAVREIIGDNNGGIYLATEDGGVNHIDQDRKITRFSHLKERLHLSDLNTHSLLIDSDHNLWTGTFSQGAACSSLSNPNKAASYAVKNISIFSIMECSNGEVWLGHPRGITTFKHTPQSGTNKETGRHLLQNFTYCMIQLNDSIVLAGTKRRSVWKINLRTKEESQITIEGNNTLFITYLHLDSNKNIWVGTDKDGLYKLDSNAKVIDHFDSKELSNNSIKGIVEDLDGNIWVGTNRGLCMIDTSRNVSRFTTADGLPINQFNYASAYRSEDGEVFFGTIKGMISFFPDHLTSENTKFNIHITKLITGDESLPTKGSSIELSHKQAQSLSVDFSGLNYQYGQRTQYAMQLEGVDDDWVNIGTQHQLRLSNLSAGSYKLKLKASTDGVTWNENGAKTLSIIVHPVWWQSKLAYSFYFLLIIAGAFIIYLYLKKRMLLEVSLENEKQARRDADSLNKQKINFFTYVSHDLKTPLTLILSPLRKIGENNNLDQNDRERLDVVYRNAVRMDYLIDELLNFSKIEMNQREILVRCGDMMHYLEGLSTIFIMVAKEKDIRFNVDIKHYDKQLWFSPSKMERIIYNLLSNAFKYTAIGGEVTFSAEIVLDGERERAEIKVIDNGRGIPEEKIKRIFVPYYQVEKQDHREGFGLGLPLTRSLVKLHKGVIEVESKVGEGSTFTITIPVSEGDYLEGEMSQEEITAQHMQKYNDIIKESIEMQSEQYTIAAQKEQKKSILIVEDNKDMNQYISSVFADEYKVTRVYDGTEACKALQKSIPDIIVTDVMMPNMNGYEFAEYVRSNEATTHIPIIMLTAKTSEEDVTQGYKCGVDAYIKKPFNEHNLKLLANNISNNRTNLISRFKSFAKLNIDEVATTPRDEVFIKQVIDLIMENLNNDEFSVADIVDKIKISRSQLHFKLKNIKGCSATQFIRSVKMNEAKNFMINGMNVSETSYAVGMLDPNYFTKCFKKEFDITPSDFIKQLHDE